MAEELSINIREAVAALPVWVTTVFDVVFTWYNRKERSLLNQRNTFIHSFLTVAAQKPQLTEHHRLQYLNWLLEYAHRHHSRTKAVRTVIQKIRALHEQKDGGKEVIPPADIQQIEEEVLEAKRQLTSLSTRLAGVVTDLQQLQPLSHTGGGIPSDKEILTVLERVNTEFELLDLCTTNIPAAFVNYFANGNVEEQGDQFLRLLKGAVVSSEQQSPAPPTPESGVGETTA
ncbi:hypothetical protein HY491_02435 [Candidatus Woesearchaeota archaeon]|nr:hypothetical protein [Candidatus Woesearchaeota archaeon]